MVLATLPGGHRCAAEELLGLRCIEKGDPQKSAATGREPLPRTVLRKVLEFLSRPPAHVGQAVAAGSQHTCAVTAQGRLVCFGANGSGQCSVPEGLEDVVAVAAGDQHTCAVTAQGRLVCFGDNGSGQCSVPGGLSADIAVAARYGHSGVTSSAHISPEGVVDQSIEHAEPPAVIGPDEASRVSEQRWASAVDHSIAAVRSVAPLNASDLPAQTSPNALQCLLPSAHVLTKSGVRLVTSLSEGDELIPGRSGHGATVRSMRVLPSN